MHKYGLRILGLAIMAAIGLMAFSASAALAVNLELGDKFYSNDEPAGEFLVNSGTLSPTLLATQAVAGKQLGSGRLAIPGKSAEIVCAKGEITTGSVSNEYEDFIAKKMATGGHGSGTVQFKECKTEEINPTTHELTKKTLTNCVPNVETTPGEVTANVLLLVKKHEKVTYLLAVPKVTSEASAKENEALTAAFTTMKFGPLCSLPPTVKITGSLTVKAPVADAIKPILKIDSLTKTDQELIGAKLKFGANEAFIQAEAEAELVGKNVPWGAM
ncbi:MAG TPA: hypothetical protein VIY71_04575 [Solirubrobacterales bacterium]